MARAPRKIKPRKKQRPKSIAEQMIAATGVGPFSGSRGARPKKKLPKLAKPPQSFFDKQLRKKRKKK